LRLPGQYFDGETGTHYNFHRDYVPGVGRYVQEDPIGLFGGINLYVYARSRPTSNFDAFGLEPRTPVEDRPSYEDLHAGYTNPGTDEPWPGFDLTRHLGGQLSAFDLGHPRYNNTCAVRGSHALNVAGHPISENVIARTRTDEEGLHYIISAHEFKSYLEAEWGAADVKMYQSNFDRDKLMGAENRGIIFIDMGRGRGHIDLNDGAGRMYSNDVPIDHYHHRERDPQQVIMLWRVPSEEGQ
jgi:RHS repeat-associated protein